MSTSRITIPITFRCSAPSAIRIPISRVRCATLYDITPYNPIIASTVATNPNTVDKLAIIRSVESELLIWSSIVRIA